MRIGRTQAARDIVSTMTLLTWRRTQNAAEPAIAQADAPSRASFEQLALPLLPSLYNTARWLTREPG